MSDPKGLNNSSEFTAVNEGDSRGKGEEVQNKSKERKEGTNNTFLLEKTGNHNRIGNCNSLHFRQKSTATSTLIPPKA